MALETKKTVCMFCSMGCGMLISTDRGNPVEIEYDFDNPINKGSLCARGNYMFELLGHRARLDLPKAKKDEGLKEIAWDEATKYITRKLREIKKKYGGNSIGIVMEPNSLNEEVLLGYRLAKEVLKTKNFSIAFSPEDRGMLSALDEFRLKGEKEAALDDIRCSDALFIIGDIVTKAPCLSREINKVKYGAKGNKIIVVDPKKSHTSWFGTSHMNVFPGEEAMLLAGMIKAVLDAKGKAARSSSLGRKFKSIDLKIVSARTGIPINDIRKAAHEFDAAKKATIVLCSNFGKMQDTGLAVKLSKILCNAAKGDKRLINFYTGANSLGCHLTLNAFSGGKTFPDFMEILDGARKGKIKALLLFGVDISRLVTAEGFDQIREKTKLIVTSHLFETAGSLSSQVVLPAASYAEKGGSIVSSGEVIQEVKSAISPYSGSKTYFEILSGLINELGGESLGLGQAVQEVKNKLKKLKKKTKENLAGVLKALKEAKSIKGSEDKPFVLLPDDDIVHYVDMDLTERCFWAKERCKKPHLEISASDAEKLGIKDGEKALVSSREETVELTVQITEKVSVGVVSAPHHFEEIRRLVDTKPGIVSIEKG